MPLVRSRKGTAVMGAPRSRADTLAVVATLEPLRDGPAGRLDVRIIEVRPGQRRLDVRQFLAGAGFTGYTKKGVCLSAEEFHALLEQYEAIVTALTGSRAPAGDRARRAPASR